MNKIRVSCAQFKPEIGNVAYNLEKIASLFLEFKNLQSNVFVFPEQCIQGLTSPEETESTAETIPGNSSTVICELSKEYAVYSIVGMAERVGRRIFNSSILVNPEGNIVGVYRKVHLWKTEADHLTRGKEYPVFDTDFGKVTMWICYDTRFPEVAKISAIKGARIAFIPTAWLSGHIEHWKLAVRSRALDNFMYVCGADEISKTDQHQSSGASVISNPHGQLISEADLMAETVISAELDLQVVDDLRELVPVLRDRQKQTYREILH